MRIPGFTAYSLQRRPDNGWDVIGVHGRPLARTPDAKGRVRFKLRSDDGRWAGIQLGRLVLLATGGPPPAPHLICCHRDDDPSNNDPSNLYWGTPSNNNIDAVRNGCVDRRGERNGRTKLSDEQVAAIRAEYRPARRGRPRAGEPTPRPGGIAWLAAKHGVSHGYVSCVVRGLYREVA